MTLSSDNYSLDVTQVIQNIDTESEYNFKVVATDFFSSAEYAHNLSTAYTIMDFNQSGKGIAIGKVSTQDAFEINMNMNVTGNISQNSYFNGRRMQYIPYGIGPNYGWYPALSGEINEQYDNHAFTLNVTQTYSGATGILYGNIRCNNYVLSIIHFKLLNSGGLNLNDFKIKIDGNKYYLYAKTNASYQAYLFEVISESTLNLSSKLPVFIFNLPSYSETVSEPTGTTPVSYLLDSIYPVGAIYFSISSTNPGNFMGGTWIQWCQGRVPVGVYANESAFDSPDKMGGSLTHYHDWRIGMHWYYGDACGEGNGSGTGAYVYTDNRYDGWARDLASLSVPVNNNNTTATKAVSASGKYSQGNTSSTNTFPRYTTCYMWKRTA